MDSAQFKLHQKSNYMNLSSSNTNNSSSTNDNNNNNHTIIYACEKWFKRHYNIFVCCNRKPTIEDLMWYTKLDKPFVIFHSINDADYIEILLCELKRFKEQSKNLIILYSENEVFRKFIQKNTVDSNVDYNFMCSFNVSMST